jgi:hypothetical protein
VIIAHAGGVEVFSSIMFLFSGLERHAEPSEGDRPLAGFASHLCDIKIAFQSAAPSAPAAG